MKIAMPVKRADADMPIAPLFGHAKYFAFVQDGKIEVQRNPYDGGVAVVEWLLDEGVDVVMTQHIGLRPFVLLAQNGVRCYYPGEGRITTQEALRCFEAKRCEEITENNIEKFTRHSHRHHHTHEGAR